MSRPESKAPTVEEALINRYYEPFIISEAYEKAIEDHYVYRHSNTLYIVGLAKSHPIIAEGKTVINVNYAFDGKQDRSIQKVHGKGSKGGMWVDPRSVLCIVTCSDGSEYKVYSCCRGNLVEANSRLKEYPSLLSEKPTVEGFVAIIKPRMHERHMKPNEYKSPPVGESTGHRKKKKAEAGNDTLANKRQKVDGNDEETEPTKE